MLNTKVKVSICCITYNHAPFIKQALDSFLMQKTNFPFEVIVHDDASTDGTADIIREYQKKYPQIIKAILQTENQWSKGINIEERFLWPKISGQYVALNEGDDYWTDENKLQRQVDFLDANPDFTICFHPVKVIWEDNSQPNSIFPSNRFRFNKTILDINDLLKHNFIQTNSVVYRWQFYGNNAEKIIIPEGILPTDYFLHLLHAKRGKIGFLPDVMAVYRKHSGGIWWGAEKTDEWFINCAIPHIRFYESVEEIFKVNKKIEKISMMNSLLRVSFKYKRLDILEQIALNFSALAEEALSEQKVIKCSDKYQKNVNNINNYIIYVFLAVSFLFICSIF